MKSVNQPLLFEMIRSFVTLARTLNLSRAVEEMATTRQTMRRHIEALEAAMGVQLFAVVDRRYQLTPEGERALPSAQSIQAQGRLWLQGDLSEVDGMMRMSYDDDDGWHFFIQKQKPPSSIINDYCSPFINNLKRQEQSDNLVNNICCTCVDFGYIFRMQDRNVVKSVILFGNLKGETTLIFIFFAFVWLQGICNEMIRQRYFVLLWLDLYILSVTIFHFSQVSATYLVS